MKSANVRSFRKRSVGLFVVVLLSSLYLAYAMWPPNRYFLTVLENNTGIDLKGSSRVLWKWASRPYGFPKLYTERYVAAVIENESIDMAHLGVGLIEKKDCVSDSNPVKKFLKPGVAMKCWGEGIDERRDNFFLLYVKDRNLLLYKYRGR